MTASTPSGSYVYQDALNSVLESNHGDLLLSEDWIYLNTGDKVVVHRQREARCSGRIDEVSDDATILWIHLDHGRGRILIFEGDGSMISRKPE